MVTRNDKSPLEIACEAIIGGRERDITEALNGITRLAPTQAPERCLRAIYTLAPALMDEDETFYPMGLAFMETFDALTRQVLTTLRPTENNWDRYLAHLRIVAIGQHLGATAGVPHAAIAITHLVSSAHTHVHDNHRDAVKGRRTTAPKRARAIEPAPVLPAAESANKGLRGIIERKQGDRDRRETIWSRAVYADDFATFCQQTGRGLSMFLTTPSAREHITERFDFIDDVAAYNHSALTRSAIERLIFTLEKNETLARGVLQHAHAVVAAQRLITSIGHIAEVRPDLAKQLADKAKGIHHLANGNGVGKNQHLRKPLRDLARLVGNGETREPARPIGPVGTALVEARWAGAAKKAKRPKAG